MANVLCTFKMVPKWRLWALKSVVCVDESSSYLHQSGQSVLLCACSVQLPRSIYDSYFKGECRLWRSWLPDEEPSERQENIPACTHTHDAPNLTPTAFVTRSLSDACFCIRVGQCWEKKNDALVFLKNSTTRKKNITIISFRNYS